MANSSAMAELTGASNVFTSMTSQTLTLKVVSLRPCESNSRVNFLLHFLAFRLYLVSAGSESPCKEQRIFIALMYNCMSQDLPIALFAVFSLMTLPAGTVVSGKLSCADLRLKSLSGDGGLWQCLCLPRRRHCRGYYEWSEGHSEMGVLYWRRALLHRFFCLVLNLALHVFNVKNMPKPACIFLPHLLKHCNVETLKGRNE